MKTIIVPVDFSETSLNAARYALKFAMQAGAKIILVHAFQEPLQYPLRNGTVLTSEGLWEVNLDQLQQLQAQFNTAAPLTKTEIMQLKGQLTDVVEQLQNNMQVSMVIMGITGAGKVKETLIGSNTLAVARETTLPVLIVPEEAGYERVTDIGLTTDFREVINTIPAQRVKDIAYMLGSRLHILNVDYRQEYSTPDTPLQSGLLETMFQDFSPRYHFIENENIAEGLSDYALAHGIELLIAVPRKKSFIDRIFTRSQTKQLVFQSKLPVLIIHE